MAGTGRITTGTIPRALQYGVDKFIEYYKKEYPGVGEMIFSKAPVDKGFYEAVQLAGVGLAAQKTEGNAITYDSINQSWDARFPVVTYEKSLRITMEMIQDNLYQDMLPSMVREAVKALKYNKDYQMANVLNNSTSSSFNGPDGVPLLSTAHPLQAGGTNSNRLSPDLDLSEDAVEQAKILVDNFLNPDGLQSEFVTTRLIVPTALQYVAARILGSKYRTSTGDNDIQALNYQGDVKDYVFWKRLSNSTTWYLQTNAEQSLMLAQRKDMETKQFNDPFTYDVIVTAYERFIAFFADYRGLVGSVGP